MTSVQRVLVVEDHEQFRRVLCELLRKRPDVLIVGEAADGMDAIRLAEALRPDVVVLDITLPTLSGLEVAKRIRAMVPDAKLMFVTNESSLEVAETAFSRGAHGYVYKPRAQRDVLAVFDAIVRGRRFASGGVERIARGDAFASHRHGMLFWSSDSVLIEGFTRFIAGALHEGSAVIVLVTDAHDQLLRRSLQASHADFALALRQERYISLNISDALGRVMVNGWPDPTRFLAVTGDLVAEAARCAIGQHAKVAACGECAPTLWAQGHVDAALQLERLWDKFAAREQIDILCAFPVAAREESASAVRSLCAEHTAVEIG